VGRSSKYVDSVTQFMYATLYFIVIHLLSFIYPFPVPIFIYCWHFCFHQILAQDV